MSTMLRAIHQLTQLEAGQGHIQAEAQTRAHFLSNEVSIVSPGSRNSISDPGYEE
jgi:hypothetical protein